MSDVKYTYAVARIRAMEMSLFNSAMIEQLLAMKDYDACLQFLAEKGWGDPDTPMDAEAILSRESEKTWSAVRELIRDDASVLDVLFYPNLFHNLKAAIKESVTGKSHGKVYFDDCSIDPKEMLRIIQDRDYLSLPENMRAAAQEAHETFLHTGDGQLCDIIVDRACLEVIYKAGQEADASIIRDYAESTVAVADIKIAVRSQKTAKTLEFMKRALAPCGSLNTDRLAAAALSGMDAICEYLEGTAYAEGAQALKESPSAFERWCDNQVIRTIQPQKYNPFSVGPLVAYVLARGNEIKTVRIILSGKQNGLPEESIRERVREMYV